MNRSGNAGFNGLVFFGNRGDGLFLLEGRGCGGVLRESCCLLLLSLRWFEPKVSNRARQIRIKDSRIPLNTVAARKEKAVRCWMWGWASLSLRAQTALERFV